MNWSRCSPVLVLLLVVGFSLALTDTLSVSPAAVSAAAAGRRLHLSLSSAIGGSRRDDPGLHHLLRRGFRFGGADRFSHGFGRKRTDADDKRFDDGLQQLVPGGSPVVRDLQQRFELHNRLQQQQHQQHTGGSK